MTSGQQGIYSLLKANMDIWLNIEDISKYKDTTYAQVCRYLGKMMKYPDLFIGLETKFQEDTREGRTFSVKYYRVSSNVFKAKSRKQ